MEQILKMMEESNFSFLEFPNGYKDRNSIIKYSCSLGHLNEKKFREFLKSKTCTECVKIKVVENQKGYKGSNWHGGLTFFRRYMKNMLDDWCKESRIACNYRSVVSGERVEEVHHLYSLNLIVRDAIIAMNLQDCSDISLIPEDTRKEMVKLVQDLHFQHPLGACLTKKEHKAFHKFYGQKDNTPEQFYEFKSRIESGEIIINQEGKKERSK
jgi:hypothetical protein